METNGFKELGINASTYHAQFAQARYVPWTAKGLRIDRLRLLSDPGFPWWDVSYCTGFIGDEPVRVQLPFDQLPKVGTKRALYTHAKASGRYIDGLFDAVSSLV